MNTTQDKKNTPQNNDEQSGERKNLDDLFNADSNTVAAETPEDEAAAEQQRKEALTERD